MASCPFSRPDANNVSVTSFFQLVFAAGGSVRLRRAFNALAEFQSDGSFLGTISPAHVSLISAVRPGSLLAVLDIADSNMSHVSPVRIYCGHRRRFFDAPRLLLINKLNGSEPPGDGDVLDIRGLRVRSRRPAKGVNLMDEVGVAFFTWSPARWGMDPRMADFTLYDNEGVQTRIEKEIEQLTSPFPVRRDRTSIGIPSEALINLLIHLRQFGKYVSVRVTSTEVKFSVVNENVVYKTEFEECIIKGVRPRHPISFTFSLHYLEGILNTCVLSNIVWFHYLLDRDHPMMQCAVLPIGHITLYPDCFT